MAPLVIPLSQPVVTGLVFLIFDMIFLAIFFAGTTRLATYLTRKRMEKGKSLTIKEVEVPHISGGLGAMKPDVQAMILSSRAVSIIMLASCSSN